MKKTLTVIFALSALLGMMGCEQPVDGGKPGNGAQNQTPISADFIVSGLSTMYDGDPKAVSVTPKPGKSAGAISVYYAGINSTSYAKSSTAPTAAGNYAVTFNVAAAAGFNAANGLSAGMLIIRQPVPDAVDPVAADFTVSGLSAIADGSPKPVSVTPKAGKSAGAISVYYEGIDGTSYVKNCAAPSAAGTYAVTFNVAAAAGFNAASGLSAGTLVISQAAPSAADPVAADFTVSGLSAIADGSPKTVSVTPKAGKSAGAISVYYEGINGTSYAKSSAAPTAAGTYAVTFNVAAADGFNAASGLSAGTLVITEESTDPFILFVDFEDSVWASGNYNRRTVNWGGFEWLVYGVGNSTATDRYEGTRSIRLRGNTTDTGDAENRVELTTYLATGIESISFDYASYGTHKNGVIALYYQIEGNSDWIEVDRVSVLSWADAGQMMLNARFDLNVTDSARFKIVKLIASGSTSVNIDNIVITRY